MLQTLNPLCALDIGVIVANSLASQFINASNSGETPIDLDNGPVDVELTPQLTHLFSNKLSLIFDQMYNQEHADTPSHNV